VPPPASGRYELRGRELIAPWTLAETGRVGCADQPSGRDHAHDRADDVQLEDVAGANSARNDPADQRATDAK
jgi:hypothetical protein